MDNQVKVFLGSIRTVYVAILISMLLFAGVSIILYFSGLNFKLFDAASLEYLKIAGILIALTLVPLAYYLFKIKLNNIDSTMPIESRVVEYRSALIVKYALIEAAAFLNTLAFLVSSNSYFLIPTLVCVVIFLLNFPTSPSLHRDLQLLENEAD